MSIPRPSSLNLMVNGQAQQVVAAADTALLYVLRNDLMLNGPKYGCGLGECGACTVLVDGKPARSCVLPVGLAQGLAITTLEGLGTIDSPHPVQAAFIEQQAAQCGFCLNGMIMMITALLGRNRSPSEAEIRECLRYNLCRCGAHYEIIQAALRASDLLREEVRHEQ